MKFKKIIVLAISTMTISCRSLPPELKKLEDFSVFKVSKDKQAIILDGVINSSAFKDFKKLANEYPTIKVLKIVNCEGSINDDVNLELAKYVYKQRFNTYLNDNGLIASGGTDLFLAGRKRSLGKNIRVGVHSWGDGKDIQATDFPRDHKQHKPYIEYYQSIGFTSKEAEDFYFFTIKSAPTDSIHWMTVKEIELYRITNTKDSIVVYKNIPNEILKGISESLFKEIIGKWKLQGLKIGVDIITPKDAMGTSEVYQNYEKNNSFTSSVGKRIDKGTWQFFKERKTILINSSGSKSIFKIIDFKNDLMTLLIYKDGQEILLNYKKVISK